MRESDEKTLALLVWIQLDALLAAYNFIVQKLKTDNVLSKS